MSQFEVIRLFDGGERRGKGISKKGKGYSRNCPLEVPIAIGIRGVTSFVLKTIR